MIGTYLSVFLASFIFAFVVVKVLIPRLKREGMIGKDENKVSNPEVAEMGGFGTVAGFTAGMLLAIFLDTFLLLPFNLVFLLAAVITAHSIAFIGIIDDFIGMPQRIKALLPLFAAIPLVAVKAAGSTIILIPFVGPIDFGIAYILILVPLAVAVCSNLTNMLAGFNGMEAGVGIIMFSAIFLIGVSNASYDMAIVSLAMLAALGAFLLFNLYPARVFPGDVMNLSIGVVLATAVIIGNYESAGIILMIPFILDFLIKAKNGFPHTHQDIRSGRLYPKEGKVKGLVHVVMNAFNGITEQNLTIFFVGLEVVFALIVLAMYFKF